MTEVEEKYFHRPAFEPYDQTKYFDFGDYTIRLFQGHRICSYLLAMKINALQANTLEIFMMKFRV